MPYQVARYRKRQPRRGKRRGRGLFGNIWKGIRRFGNKANRFLKKTKAISSIAPLFGPKGKALGAVAGRAGYGRRRRMVKGRRRYRRKGQGISVAGGARGKGIRLAGRGRASKKRLAPRGMAY